MGHKLIAKAWGELALAPEACEAGTRTNLAIHGLRGGASHADGAGILSAKRHGDVFPFARSAVLGSGRACDTPVMMAGVSVSHSDPSSPC